MTEQLRDARDVALVEPDREHRVAQVDLARHRPAAASTAASSERIG